MEEFVPERFVFRRDADIRHIKCPMIRLGCVRPEARGESCLHIDPAEHLVRPTDRAAVIVRWIAEFKDRGMGTVDFSLSASPHDLRWRGHPEKFQATYLGPAVGEAWIIVLADEATQFPLVLNRDLTRGYVRPRIYTPSVTFMQRRMQGRHLRFLRS